MTRAQLLLSILAPMVIQIKFLGVLTAVLVPEVSGELRAISIQLFWMTVVPGMARVPVVLVIMTLVPVPTLGCRLLALLTWTAIGQAAALLPEAFPTEMWAIAFIQPPLRMVLVATRIPRFIARESTRSLLMPTITLRQSRLQTM